MKRTLCQSRLHGYNSRMFTPFASQMGYHDITSNHERWRYREKDSQPCSNQGIQAAVRRCRAGETDCGDWSGFSKRMEQVSA